MSLRPRSNSALALALACAIALPLLAPVPAHAEAEPEAKAEAKKEAATPVSAPATTTLRIHDGTSWQTLDPAAWDKLPRTEITAKARDGKDRVFSGVALAEVLKLAKAPAGDTLRGAEMNRVVLIAAADGYQVAFSLAELDPSFRKQNILLADQADGQPLSEFEGPRMIVAADDQRHSRWIRQIKDIILTRPLAPKSDQP